MYLSYLQLAIEQQIVSDIRVLHLIMADFNTAPRLRDIELDASIIK